MPCLSEACRHRSGRTCPESSAADHRLDRDLAVTGGEDRMRRSSSFPGAIPNDSASDALLVGLTAQLRRPAVPLGPASSPSSDDEDSDTFAEDWAVADDASTPTRCVFTLSGICTRVLLLLATPCLQTSVLSNILVG